MATSVPVTSVMRAPVRTFQADLAVIDALQLAERSGMHHLPLLERGKMVGLICTCDLEGVDLKTPIREALTREVVVIAAESSAEAAMRLMATQGVGSLLVVQNDTVVGIVTREDLSGIGLDLDDAQGFRCESCGSVKHLKTEGTRGTLCLDCRAHADPEAPGDETGVVD
jgi:predicted transcriptional regulator